MHARIVDIGHLFDHGDGFAERFLPALVLGRNGQGPQRRRTSPPPVEPRWMLTFAHQYDGYSCSQAELRGLVMPLRGRSDTREVMANLDVLACDSLQAKEIRERPDLQPLHLARGSYDANQREVLARALSSCPSLPRPIGGHEALVELDATDVGRRLAGWTVIAGEPGAVDSSPPTLHAYAQLDENLVALAEAHFRPNPLRLYLLWLNSD
jgi:hypothetical protein